VMQSLGESESIYSIKYVIYKPQIGEFNLLFY